VGQQKEGEGEDKERRREGKEEEEVPRRSLAKLVCAEGFPFMGIPQNRFIIRGGGNEFRVGNKFYRGNKSGVRVEFMKGLHGVL
jgi:hypothetical protein